MSSPHRPSDANKGQRQRGIPLRQVVPNAVTAVALCTGLSSVRFAYLAQWELAVTAIVAAAILDALDGRIARMLGAQSRFGAELDSLSDVIAFGVAPTVLLFFWSTQHMPQFGWLMALSLTLACALRLARFNAQIDDEDSPHRSGGYLTGVPSPAGAGLALMPVLLWFMTGNDLFRNYWLIGGWAMFVAFLLVSSIATFGWSSLRLRRNIRFEAIGLIALFGAAAISVPWLALFIIGIAYLLSIPFSILSYRRYRTRKAQRSSPPEPSL